MPSVTINMSRHERDAVWSHLLPPGAHDEEAAFLFVQPDEAGNVSAPCLRVLDWTAVNRGGFAYQSGGYLELMDDMVASLIKRAHDLRASLVELHSHPSPWPAAFSITDLQGLAEFVPHVRWRLKGAAYVAIVVAPSGFDALAWYGASTRPCAFDGIVIDGEVQMPTGTTFNDHFRMGSHDHALRSQ